MGELVLNQQVSLIGSSNSNGHSNGNELIGNSHSNGNDQIDTTKPCNSQARNVMSIENAVDKHRRSATLCCLAGSVAFES